MSISNFKPVLFFYEWQLVYENATDIGSGLVTAKHEEDLASHKLIYAIKENLMDDGHNRESVINGRLLDIRKID